MITNTDCMLMLIAIILTLKDCKGANYKAELREIKNELSQIKQELAKREREDK